MYQKYIGIILKKHALGEADEMLTVYTKQDGKLRFRSVSSRKIKSRMAGHLLTLNEIEFETAVNKSSGLSGNLKLPVIVSVRALSVNNYLRQDLRKFAHAVVVAETLYRLTADGQENKQAYSVLRNFLSSLSTSRQEAVLVKAVQLHLLSCYGYHIPLQSLGIDEDAKVQLTTLLEGGIIDRLKPQAEKSVENFLEYVLEREIKSKSFLNSVTH